MALDASSKQEESGFLSRWSQRKQALRKGEALPEPAKPAQDAFLKQNQPPAGIESVQSAPDLIVNESDGEKPEAQPPTPTLQDAQQLTPQSDFKPFMRSDVSPEVKNAAMKQLFKDPHFNTMDMMDVYVDDYSKPDPLPPEMLRKMAVTHFLGFWKEEEEEEAKKLAEQKAREDAEASRQQNVAQSEAVETRPETAITETTEESQACTMQAPATEHDHPDLQLQPDDAAGREIPRPSAG